jgi:uncharacterized Zn-finger protein
MKLPSDIQLTTMRPNSLADSIKTANVSTPRLKWRVKILITLNAVIATLAVVIFLLLFQLDGIVHGLLYEHGLIFDYDWAVPYWTFERLTMLFLVAMIGTNVCSMYLLFSSARTHSVSNESAPILLETELVESKTNDEKTSISKERKPKEDLEETGVEIADLPMVCKTCSKVITQPLCMLDFKSGKPRLINVCPYCNAVIAEAADSRITE